jgi:hypothetical protein
MLVLRGTLALIVASAALVLLGAAGQAGAAVNATSQTLAAQRVGSHFVVMACDFAPQSPVAITVNGTNDAKGTTNSAGCTPVAGAVSNPKLAINGGTPVHIAPGANVITITGLSPASVSVTDLVYLPFIPPHTTVKAVRTDSEGADVMGLIVGALALLAVLFLIVTFVRRRGPRLS